MNMSMKQHMSWRTHPLNDFSRAKVLTKPLAEHIRGRILDQRLCLKQFFAKSTE
jgi:hypothetical protein